MVDALLIATATLAFIRIALFVALHVVGDYSVVGHAVSDYAVGRTRTLSAAMTWVTAGMFACLAAATWWGLDGWSARTSTSLLLLTLVVIFVVLPALPTDLEGEPTTIVGRAHLAAAVAWFAIAYIVTGTYTDLLGELDSPMAGLLSVLHTAATVSLIALVVALLPKLRPMFFGLSERVFLVTISLFFLLLPFALLGD